MPRIDRGRFRIFDDSRKKSRTKVLRNKLHPLSHRFNGIFIEQNKQFGGSVTETELRKCRANFFQTTLTNYLTRLCFEKYVPWLSFCCESFCRFIENKYFCTFFIFPLQWKFQIEGSAFLMLQKHFQLHNTKIKHIFSSLSSF